MGKPKKKEKKDDSKKAKGKGKDSASNETESLAEGFQVPSCQFSEVSLILFDKSNKEY